MSDLILGILVALWIGFYWLPWGRQGVLERAAMASVTLLAVLIGVEWLARP